MYVCMCSPPKYLPVFVAEAGIPKTFNNPPSTSILPSSSRSEDLRLALLRFKAPGQHKISMDTAGGNEWYSRLVQLMRSTCELSLTSMYQQSLTKLAVFCGHPLFLFYTPQGAHEFQKHLPNKSVVNRPRSHQVKK